MSDQSKFLIDQEVNKLLVMANDHAREIILKTKPLMQDCAAKLKEYKLLKRDEIIKLIDDKYPEIWNLYDVKNKYVE